MTTVTSAAEETTPLRPPLIKLKSGGEIKAVGETVALWAKLARCDLQHAHFQGGTYRALLLAGLDLTSANWIDADLSDCDLTGAVLLSLIGERVKLMRAVFNCTAMESTCFTEADLTGATLIGTKAKVLQAVGATFDEATFKEGRFENSRFDGASFTKATLKGTEFYESNLSHTVFDGARLEDVEFSGCNLSHATFIKTKTKNCKFNSVDLSSVDFTGADLEGAEFRACVFTGMTLKDAVNIPQNIDQCGSTKVVDVLVRRANALGNHSRFLAQAFSKLWFQHLMSGGDLMLEPFQEVMDAALAVADSLESQSNIR